MRALMRRWSVAVVVTASIVGLLPMLAPNATAHAAVSNQVLILGATVTGGATSLEAQEVTAQGFTAVIADDATWEAMTTAQFASYRAIVIGDPTCGSYGDTSNLTAALSNPKTWGAAINGNILIIGTDPVLHSGGDPTSGPGQLVKHGIDFALAQAGKTGAYLDLSCAYGDDPPNTSVPLLDGISPGGFTVDGGPSSVCYNDAHIVATHPALTGLTDADLSNWSCSVHEAFDAWPPNFAVLGIARNYGSTYTASDGTVGTPYILASGAGLKSYPLSLNPTSQTETIGGGQGLVLATLLDGATGAPAQGVKLSFRVEMGPNQGTVGSCFPSDCVTDSNGEVDWGYLGSKIGTDTVQVWMDTNGNGVPDLGEPQTTAGVGWIPPSTLEHSLNWAGYILYNAPVLPLSAQITVPALPATCSTSTYSNYWIGYNGTQGAKSPNFLPQVGVEADCLASDYQNITCLGDPGTVHYYIWWETDPHNKGEHGVCSVPVNPGDTVALIIQPEATQVIMYATVIAPDGSVVFNWTNPVGTKKNDTYSSMECIAEAPIIGKRILPLADFGSAEFDGCSVFRDYRAGSTLKRDDIYPSKYAPPETSTGPITLNGSQVSFTVTRVGG